MAGPLMKDAYVPTSQGGSFWRLDGREFAGIADAKNYLVSQAFKPLEAAAYLKALSLDAIRGRVISVHERSHVESPVSPAAPEQDSAVADREFPVLFGDDRGRLARMECPRFVPWSLLAPHEEWAKNNHSQSLETLASRGGLDPREMVAIIQHKGLRDALAMTLADAVVELKRLLDPPGESRG